MVRFVLFIIAAGYTGTAAFMIVAPAAFYATFPNVPITGPYNMHFVIDAGIAFGVAAGLIGFGAARGAPTLARAGAAWPALHGVFHVIMIFVLPITNPEILAWEIGGVIGPAALAAWAAAALRAA